MKENIKSHKNWKVQQKLENPSSFPSDLDAGFGGHKGGRADRSRPYGNIVCYRALDQIHTCLKKIKTNPSSLGMLYFIF